VANALARGVLCAGRPLTAGMIAALGHAPLSWPFATLAGFALAGWLFRSASTIRGAAVLGWLFGSGYFLASIYWIVDPFMVEPDRYGWMAPFALIFMAGGLALFWGAAFMVAAWGAQRLGRPHLRLVLLPLALMGAEFARGSVFTGFPWNLPAYVWMDTPVSQMLALIGPFGLTFATVALAIWPLAGRRIWGGGVATVVILAGLWVAGDLALQKADVAVPNPLRLRLIQPNVPQAEKWDPARMPAFFRRQLELTAADRAFAPDLVIWPETSVPFWLGERPDLQRLVADTAPKGATVSVGGRRMQGRRYYNALAVLGRHGQITQLYDKAHLVPFGEYVPFGAFLSRFGVTGMAAEDGGGFSAGSGPALLDLGKAGKVRPLICYEAIFPAEITRGLERPDWLLQITNDAWFGTTAGPQQHFAQARARAIEQGLPMVRVANTGITAVIDARGRVTARLRAQQIGKLDTTLPSALPPTPYARYGDIPAWLLAIFLSLAWLVRGRRNSH